MALDVSGEPASFTFTVKESSIEKYATINHKTFCNEAKTPVKKNYESNFVSPEVWINVDKSVTPFLQLNVTSFCKVQVVQEKWIASPWEQKMNTTSKIITLLFSIYLLIIHLSIYLAQLNLNSVVFSNSLVPCHGSGCQPRRLGFDTSPDHVICLDEMALGLVYLPVLQYSPVSNIPSKLHSHTVQIYHRRHVILAVDKMI